MVMVEKEGAWWRKREREEKEINRAGWRRGWLADGWGTWMLGVGLKKKEKILRRRK